MSNRLFTKEQIEKFTAEGRWPPPTGITFLEERPVDQEALRKLAIHLSEWLPPKGRKVVKKVFKL